MARESQTCRCRRDRRPSLLQCSGHRTRRPCRRSRLDAHASSGPAAVFDRERRRSPSLPAGRLLDRGRWAHDPNARARARVRELEAVGLRIADRPTGGSRGWPAGFRHCSPSRIRREHTACAGVVRRPYRSAAPESIRIACEKSLFGPAKRCFSTSTGKRCRAPTRSWCGCTRARCGCGRKAP